MAVPETVKVMMTPVAGLLLPATRLMVIGVPKLPSLILAGLAMRSNMGTAWGMMNQVVWKIQHMIY